jgi:hypothetical protein
VHRHVHGQNDADADIDAPQRTKRDEKRKEASTDFVHGIPMERQANEQPLWSKAGIGTFAKLEMDANNKMWASTLFG